MVPLAAAARPRSEGDPLVIHNLKQTAEEHWGKILVASALGLGLLLVGKQRRALLWREDLPFFARQWFRDEPIKLLNYFFAAPARWVGGLTASLWRDGIKVARTVRGLPDLQPALVASKTEEIDYLITEMLHDRESFRVLIDAMIRAPARSTILEQATKLRKEGPALVAVLDDSTKQGLTAAIGRLMPGTKLPTETSNQRFFHDLYEAAFREGAAEGGLHHHMREALRPALFSWHNTPLHKIRDAALREQRATQKTALGQALLWSGTTGDNFGKRIIAGMAPWRQRAYAGWLDDSIISVRTELRLACAKEVAKAMSPNLSRGYPDVVLSPLNRLFDGIGVSHLDRFLSRHFSQATGAITRGDPRMAVGTNPLLWEKILLRQARMTQDEVNGLQRFADACASHPTLSPCLIGFNGRERVFAVGIAAGKEQSRHLAPYLDQGDAIHQASRKLRSVRSELTTESPSTFRELANEFEIEIESPIATAGSWTRRFQRVFGFLGSQIFTEEVRRFHRPFFYIGGYYYFCGRENGDKELGITLAMLGGNYYLQKYGLAATYAMDIILAQRVIQTITTKLDGDSADLYDTQRTWGSYFEGATMMGVQLFFAIGVNAAYRVPWGGIFANLPFLRLLPSMNAPLWFGAYRGGTNKPSLMARGVWWKGMPLSMIYSGAAIYSVAYFVTRKEKLFNASEDYALQKLFYYMVNGLLVNPIGFLINRKFEAGNPFADIRTTLRQTVERVLGVGTHYVSLQGGDVLAGKGDFVEKELGLLREAKEGHPEAKREAWQVFSSRYSIDITGTWYREDIVPPYNPPEGRSWQPHFFRPSYHMDQLRSWFTEGQMKFSDGNKHQGFFVEVARNNPELLGQFLSGFEEEIADPKALWRRSMRDYKREAESKSIYHFSLFAKYYAWRASQGARAYQPFADMIERSPFREYWKAVPQARTEQEAMRAIVLSEDEDHLHLESPEYRYAHRDDLMAYLRVTPTRRGLPGVPIVHRTLEECAPLEGNHEILCVEEVMEEAIGNPAACHIQSKPPEPDELWCCDNGDRPSGIPGCDYHFIVSGTGTLPQDDLPFRDEEKMARLKEQGAFWVFFSENGKSLPRVEERKKKVHEILKPYEVSYQPPSP